MNSARMVALHFLPVIMQLFYQGYFPQAKNLFADIAAKDAVAKAYVQKCAELIAQPPSSWQGVWVVTQK